MFSYSTYNLHMKKITDSFCLWSIWLSYKYSRSCSPPKMKSEMSRSKVNSLEAWVSTSAQTAGYHNRTLAWYSSTVKLYIAEVFMVVLLMRQPVGDKVRWRRVRWLMMFSARRIPTECLFTARIRRVHSGQPVSTISSNLHINSAQVADHNDGTTFRSRIRFLLAGGIFG